jgi:hypothetical protein
VPARPRPSDLLADVQAALFAESPDLGPLEARLVHFGGEPTLNFPAIRAATEYVEEDEPVRDRLRDRDHARN